MLKIGNTLALCILVVFAAAAACLKEPASPFNPNSVSQTDLIVNIGYTEGPPYSGPGEISPYEGEYSAFSLFWTEVENCEFYEIRASEVPITTENWNEAILVEVIQAPADSGLAFNVIEILPEPCIACGLCESTCPNDAVTVQGGVAVIDYARCTSCGLCVDVCPVNAINGTRNGTEYYFGVRAFLEEDLPVEEISITQEAYKIIFFNARGSYWLPQSKNCGLCVAGEDSLGCYGGCFILQDWADIDRTIFTGTGCPFDAIWQDTMGTGPVNNMIYIDYDLCQNCGKCFLECWNYNSVIDPTMSYQGLRSVMHRVVQAGWVSDQPLRP